MWLFFSNLVLIKNDEYEKMLIYLVLILNIKITKKCIWLFFTLCANCQTVLWEFGISIKLHMYIWTLIVFQTVFYQGEDNSEWNRQSSRTSLGLYARKRNTKYSTWVRVIYTYMIAIDWILSSPKFKALTFNVTVFGKKIFRR